MIPKKTRKLKVRDGIPVLVGIVGPSGAA